MVKHKKIVSPRFFFYNYLLFAICHVLMGCATVPNTDGIRAYNINGTAYVPLAALCQAKGIKVEYDTYAKTVTLSRDAHKISLMVGQNLVLADGLPQYLKHPVAVHEGAVVVPHKFKDEVIDILLKSPVASAGLDFSSSPIKTIVIDAGHGGTDPGAIAKTGLKEKIVTLDIAKRLSSMLRQAGFNVVMTRSTDTFIPLPRRVEITNKSGADLFVSIHANANRVRSLSGFEVYYISPYTDDTVRAWEAAKVQRLDFDSVYLANDSRETKAILWNLLFASSRADSVQLARDVCRTVNDNIGVCELRIKGANYFVLKGARMPAVLIETGYLSNAEEERKLRNSYYRQQIAEAIKEGIHRFTQDLILAEARSR